MFPLLGWPYSPFSRAFLTVASPRCSKCAIRSVVIVISRYDNAMTEQETFNANLKKILSVSKEEMNRRLAAEKQSKTVTASRAPVVRAKRD
jgi:hypothetical protein